MKKYLSFFKMRLMAGLQYRTAALAGLSTQFVWGAMEILIYRAFWLEHPERFPMGMQALASYVWLQQAFLTLFALWQWEQELIQSVRTGDVAYELIRPMDLYGMWMTRSLALRLGRALLRLPPVVLLGSLVPAPYGLRLTVSPAVFGLFLLSAGLMMLVVCGMVMFLYALTFHLTDPNGVQVVATAAADLLGGAIVPLPFLPAGLRRIAELSPFGAMQNVPLRIFGGDIAGADIPRAMGLQLFWAAVLIAGGWVLMRAGLRRTAVAGG